MLVDEKRLELEKPLSEYFSDLKMYNPYTSDNVTIEDMLCHRTGVPRYDFAWYARQNASREEVAGLLKYLKPSFDFREHFQYNNFMYVYAGMTIQRISGDTWEDFVQKRIFNPLGMNNSNFSVNVSQKSSDFALPYKIDTENVKEIPSDMFKPE